MSYNSCWFAGEMSERIPTSLIAMLATLAFTGITDKWLNNLLLKKIILRDDIIKRTIPHHITSHQIHISVQRLVRSDIYRIANDSASVHNIVLIKFTIKVLPQSIKNTNSLFWAQEHSAKSVSLNLFLNLQPCLSSKLDLWLVVVAREMHR